MQMHALPNIHTIQCTPCKHTPLNADNDPTTQGVPRERLSPAMLPQVPPMDYDIIFPIDELDLANKDKKRYPSNFKVISNVL